MNSKQTLKIVRRWNDVQRRNRLKTSNAKGSNGTTGSDCADENLLFYPDDISLSYSNGRIGNDDNPDFSSKTSLIQSTYSIPIDQCSSRNINKKADAYFDRLTRDIQFAVSEAYISSMTTTTKVM